MTKHCSKSNSTAFADKCAKHGNDCFGQLDIDCRGAATSCKSKYFQLPEGGIGLSADLDHAEDDAYCGPWGKCIGKIHMKVNLHSFPKLTKAVEPVAVVAAAAPAPAAAAVAPAPAAAGPAPAAPAAVVVVKEEAAADVWLECGLPKVDRADIDLPGDWITCEAKAEGDKAACDIPMDISLKAAKHTKGYCLLKEKSTGNRLTQPAYTKVINVHGKTDVKDVPVKAAAPKPEPAKPAKEKEVVAEPAKEKEVVAEPAVAHADDDTKLPWMKDKEARQAARAAEAKTKPAPVKAAVKKTPEAPPSPEEAIEEMHEADNGELPWMKGK